MSPPSRREALSVLILALVALALRLLAARGFAFWEDDLGTIAEAVRIVSWHEFFRASVDNWHPPLSFMVVKAWMALLGLAGRSGEELAFRIPFLLAGTASVPLSWAVARRFLGSPLSAVGVAANPLLLWCDRDIRCYALLVPLSLAAVLFWLRARENGRAHDLVLFSLFSALACWDHYNAIPFVVSLFFLWALEARGETLSSGKQSEWARLTLALVLLAVLYAPWIPSLRDHIHEIPLERHQERVQLKVPPVALTSPAYVLFGMTLGHTVFPWNLAIVVPVALACAMLVVFAIQRAREDGDLRALVLGLALPIAGAAATPFRMPRYHVACVPFLLIVLARGAEMQKASRKRLALAASACVLAGFLVSDANLFRGRELHFLYALDPWPRAEAIVREWPAPVLADLDWPFATAYVRDLAVIHPEEVEPLSVRAVWVLEDARTPRADVETRARRDWLAKLGFKIASEDVLLVDPDAASRRRWLEPVVARTAYEAPVRLLRFER